MEGIRWNPQQAAGQGKQERPTLRNELQKANWQRCTSALLHDGHPGSPAFRRTSARLLGRWRAAVLEARALLGRCADVNLCLPTGSVNAAVGILCCRPEFMMTIHFNPRDVLVYSTNFQATRSASR